jgi:hypothetical protein
MFVGVVEVPQECQQRWNRFMRTLEGLQRSDLLNDGFAQALQPYLLGFLEPLHVVGDRKLQLPLVWRRVLLRLVYREAVDKMIERRA